MPIRQGKEKHTNCDWDCLSQLSILPNPNLLSFIWKYIYLIAVIFSLRGICISLVVFTRFNISFFHCCEGGISWLCIWWWWWQWWWQLLFWTLPIFQFFCRGSVTSPSQEVNAAYSWTANNDLYMHMYIAYIFSSSQSYKYFGIFCPYTHWNVVRTDVRAI